LIYTVDEGIPPNVTQIGTATVPLPISALRIMNLDLYVNNLYTYPDIYRIIYGEIGATMIRVHKRQITPLVAATDRILLNSLQYPGEFISVGFRNKLNANDFDRWYLMGSDNITTDTNHINTLHVPAIIWNMTHAIRQLVTREAIHSSSLNSIIDTMGVTTFAGIVIYPTLPYNFFNDYLPIKYNKNTAVISPYDNNMFLVTFCLYPGKQNPSGFYNFSSNREIYIEYTMNADYGADLINNQYELIASMSALNFMIRDTNYDNPTDSIRLKYSM